MTEASKEERRQLRRIRLASVLEATTLAVPVFVAVPLKHVFGMPQIVSAMGPIHGLAFLFYIWMLIQSHFQLEWSGAEWLRMVGIRLHPAGRFRQRTPAQTPRRQPRLRMKGPNQWITTSG